MHCCGVGGVNVGGTGWNNNRNEGAFVGVFRHAAPSNAVVVASRGIAPVGVKAVVDGAATRRLVLGDGLCARGECFQVG